MNRQRFPIWLAAPIYEEQKRILETLRVSDAEQALIFGGNFERLF
jgi:hypothetical protein